MPAARGGGWPKVIRDPVHDLIAFENNPVDRLLLRLTNCTEVQRLRRVKQLGFADLVFPSASHSRFSHSLGVLAVARRFLSAIERAEGRRFAADQKAVVLSAALLHDVGHGPFSHVFERVTLEDHEAYSQAVVADPATEVHAALRQFDPDLPTWVTRFLQEDTDAPDALPLPRCLTHVVSSQLDADRCDYLLRDSHMTGSKYGSFDLAWLLAQLRMEPGGARLFLEHKGLWAAESYLFARFHMYRTVYFHKATRSAETMLRLVFLRYRELLNDGRGSTARLVPCVPAALERCLTPHPAGLLGPALPVDDYLACDDATVLEFLKAARHGNDPALAGLARGLLDRQLFKAVELTGRSAAAVQAVCAAVGDECGEGLGAAPVLDTPRDTPYKPYDPAGGAEAGRITVATPFGDRREIAAVSDTVRALQSQYELVRVYVPPNRARAARLAAAAALRGYGAPDAPSIVPTP